MRAEFQNGKRQIRWRSDERDKFRPRGSLTAATGDPRYGLRQQGRRLRRVFLAGVQVEDPFGGSSERRPLIAPPLEFQSEKLKQTRSDFSTPDDGKTVCSGIPQHHDIEFERRRRFQLLVRRPEYSLALFANNQIVRCSLLAD